MDRKAEIARLRDEAEKASSRGDGDTALAAYESLEQLEPHNTLWPKRIGEVHRRHGRGPEAVAAWTRAAERFARDGLVVKAIALLHLILRQDPDNEEAQRQIAAINEGSALGGRPDERAGGARDAAGGRADVPAPRGAPLVDMPLREAVGSPASEETRGAASEPTRSSVDEIPIMWEDEAAAPEAETAARAPDAGGDIDPSRRAMRQALARTPLFSDLPPDSLESLVGKIELVEVAEGETVFREGDAGDALYVVAEGKVAVRSAGAAAPLAELGEGAFFGEIALVTDESRSATVSALEPTELLRISREVVSDLVRDRRDVLGVILSFLRERLLERLVATSPLFAPLGGEERRTMARRFRLLQAPADAELIRQGSSSGGLFILLCGAAEVHHTDGDETRRIAVLGRGDIFGEISLLTGDSAVASVRTTRRVLALEMPAGDFREVIMTHPQVLAFVGELAETRRRSLRDALAGGADYAEESLDLV